MLLCIRLCDKIGLYYFEKHVVFFVMSLLVLLQIQNHQDCILKALLKYQRRIKHRRTCPKSCLLLFAKLLKRSNWHYKCEIVISTVCSNKLRLLGYIKEATRPQRISQQLSYNLRLEINI